MFGNAWDFGRHGTIANGDTSLRDVRIVNYHLSADHLESGSTVSVGELDVLSASERFSASVLAAE